LQAQAEITRHYRALKQLIENEEKNLLSYNLIRSREHLDKINNQLQTVNDALIETAAKSSLHDQEYQTLKNKLNELTNKRSEEDQKLRAISQNIAQKENELLLLGERESHFLSQLEQNRQRIKQLDILEEELTAQKEIIKKDTCEKESSLQQSMVDLEDYKSKLADHEDSALAGEVQRQQDLIYQAGVKKESAGSTIEELKQRLLKINNQVLSMQADKEVIKDKQAENENNLFEQQKNYQELKVSLGKLDQQKEDVAKEKNGIKEKYERLSDQEKHCREEIQGLKSKLQLLKDQDTAMSGYYRGVKEIIQAGDKLPGIIAPVADLITVDNRYVHAIESALGSSLQYLVATTEESVFKAINFLKEHKFGWATFLPLNIIHKGSDPLERYPGWRDQPGVAGKASELVKTKDAYRDVVDYLLSAILVCENMEDAARAAKHIKYSCRVVTLEGEMINPGGVIRGGSIPQRSASQPLGRRKEIDALQNSFSDKDQELRELHAAINLVKTDMAKIDSLSESVDNKWHEANKELTEVQRRIDHAEHNAQVFREKLQNLEISFNQFKDEEKETGERINQLEKVIDDCSECINNLNKELAGKRESYEKYLTKKKELEQLVTEAMVKVGAYKEQFENLKKRYDETEISLKKPLMEKEQMLKDCLQLENEITVNKNKCEELANTRENMEQDKAALVKCVDEISKQLNQAEADLIELDESGRRRQSQQSRQERREKDLTVEQARLQTDISYQEMRFKELFHTMELAFIEDDFNPEECNFAVINLKDDLEALGEVNLGAIEELNRLEERINFLKDQRDDLDKGENALRKVLAEIDERMEYYFTKAFDEISVNFKTTFQELFEGGHVILRLTDKEDILESGIEIIVQPPGKKLQNITLLSAGEKVLTAIALVFAILRYKPAPFYLLDEVESALDDANLGRFTSFLKQTTNNAQFILITHRRKTMEEAEVLYGVTMPEPGVSKLMSVKPGDL